MLIYVTLCAFKDTLIENFTFINSIFNNSNEEKILGITLDKKLTFKSHIKNWSKEVLEKFGTLSRHHLIDSQKK